MAAAFASAAPAAVRAALERRLEALLEARSEWWETLAPDVAEAFRSAAAGAVRAGAAEVERRLRATDLWLSPLTAPGVVAPSGAGWDSSLPDWLTAVLRRFTRRPGRPELGELDDPSNRIWVALLSAATPLDPVLEEFGLAPSSIPDLGGGHYGLQPRTAEQLDPSGGLIRLWRHYRLAYARYAALAAARRP